MAVRDEIAHIFLHIDAEDVLPDPSQLPGVSGRAQKVRTMLSKITGGGRTISRADFIAELEAANNDPDLDTELAAFDKNDDGERIHTNLSEWVGKGMRGTPKRNG